MPLALSDLVATLRDRGLLDVTITAGHAFGGDYEAVSVYSALAVAKYVANADIAIVAMGAVTPEAIAAHEAVTKDFSGAGLLVLTSPDRLHADWLQAQRERGRTTGVIDRTPSPVERLLEPLSRDARIVTVMDGHPLALSWLGSVRGHRVVPLGIEKFGQSGDIQDLYATYKLDATAIIDAVARAV